MNTKTNFTGENRVNGVISFLVSVTSIASCAHELNQSVASVIK